MSWSAESSNSPFTASVGTAGGTRLAHAVAIRTSASARNRIIREPALETLVQPLRVRLLDRALVILQRRVARANLIEQHARHRGQRVGGRPCCLVPQP